MVETPERGERKESHVVVVVGIWPRDNEKNTEFGVRDLMYPKK